MITFALAFLLSLSSSFYLPTPIYTYLTLSQLIGFTIFAIGISWINQYRHRSNLFWHGLIGCFAALTLSASYTQAFYDDDFISGKNHTYQLIGKVVNNQIPSSLMPTTGEVSRFDNDSPRNKLRVKLHSRYPLVNNFEFYGPVVQVVYSDKRRVLQKGDWIRFTAKLNRPLGYENPFGFNLAKWAFANGIYARGKVIGDIAVIKSEPSVSQSWLNKLLESLDGVEHQGFILPLIMAERSLLSHEQASLLQQHGLSHLFAISGLHIGILFTFLFVLGRALLLLFPMSYKFELSLVLPWLFVCCFVYLIGAPISAVRATILIGIWLLLRLLKGQKSKTWVFSTMLVVSLIVQPTGVLDVGWWLSIMAVAGIFVFNHVYKRHEVNKGFCYSLWYWFKQLVLFQCFITLWLLPVTVYFFSGVSISSLWLNLLFIPLFCFILLPILFIAAALVALDFAHWGAAMMSWIDYLFDLNISLIQLLSFGVSWLDVAASMALIFAALIGLLVLAKIQSKSALLSTMALCTVMLVSGPFLGSNERLIIRVFDVGQGTAVLLSRGGQSFVYDLGPVYPSGFSATAAVIKPNLLGLGIKTIDKLVISHNDSDHFGDASAIANLIGGDTQTHCPKQLLEWQNTIIQPLWPRREGEIGSDNDTSCVLRLVDRLSNKSLLLTGDISRKVELQLVKLVAQGEIELQADVLFSAHHGSNTSSSYPFLKAVGANIVIHNTGVFNHFNFPSKQVKQRVAALGAASYSTSVFGQLLLVFSPRTERIEVRQQLNSLSSFWKKQNPFSFQVEIR